MNNLSEHFNDLLAQRAQMQTAFYSYRCNLDENAKQLSLCMSLLGKEGVTVGGIFSAKSVREILQFVESSPSYSIQEISWILQAKLLVMPDLKQGLFSALLLSEQPNIQLLAPELAMLLSTSFVNEVSSVISPSQTPELYNKFLLKLFYQKKLKQHLQEHITNKHKVSLASKTELYIDVLNGEEKSSYKLIEQFITLDYLQSHLFELYIISLNEFEATQAVNLLSSNVELTSSLLKTMALSGYSKFIPYIAQYLQKTKYAKTAFHSLKIILGDKLNQIIPLSIQFESDIEQQSKDLPYYGAKIIALWQEQSPLFTSNQMLNGLPISLETIALLLKGASQQHRYYAALHKVIKQREQTHTPFGALSSYLPEVQGAVT